MPRAAARILRLLLMLTPAPAALAQTAETDTVDYRNERWGVATRLPAGWRYDEREFPGPDGARGFLRCAGPEGAVIQAFLFTETRQDTFAAWVSYFKEQVASVAGVLRSHGRPIQDGQRPAAAIVVDAQLPGGVTRSHYYCAELAPRTVLALMHAAPLSPEEGRVAAAGGADSDLGLAPRPPEFEQLVADLRIFYDPQRASADKEAEARGRRFIARGAVKEAAARLRLDRSPRYYLIESAGRAVGFMSREISNERHSLDDPRHGKQVADAPQGLRVREEVWRFEDGGAVRMTRLDAFSSLEGDEDLYDVWIGEIPASGAEAARPVMTRRQCVRQGATLVCSARHSDESEAPPAAKPVSLPANYIGLAWARVLPALLAPESQESLTFSIFDAATGSVVPLTLRPLGEASSPGSDRRTFKSELREGLGPSSVVVTDEYGNLLRIEWEKAALSLASEQEVEQRFGARRENALRRLAAE